MEGLDTNIHCLAVEFSEWISPFVKPLKVILTKRFVSIKQSRNFKGKYYEVTVERTCNSNGHL